MGFLAAFMSGHRGGWGGVAGNACKLLGTRLCQAHSRHARVGATSFLWTVTLLLPHTSEGSALCREGPALGVYKEAWVTPALESVHRGYAVHPSPGRGVQPETQELSVVMATGAHWSPGPVSHLGLLLRAHRREGVGRRVCIIRAPVCARK